MSKNIWIINEYAGSPNHGMEYRHYYLSKELTKLGYTVTIVSATYSHLFKKLPKSGFEKVDGVNYLWIRVFNYGNSHSKKRVLKWFWFTFKLFFLRFRLSKPDVILVSPMAPFPIFPMWLQAKCSKATLIFEVKDIWPLSLIELGSFSANHPFIRFMRMFEKLALKKSHFLVSNLQNYKEHVANQRIEKPVHWISNGVDLDELSAIEPLSEEIRLNIPTSKFIIGYTGTVGIANALDSFCKAATLLKNQESIHFVIVGDGMEKERLVSLYSKESNITFIPSIPKKQIQSMLSLFDVCYLGWNDEKLYKFGTSANKLFDYMYSEKPIVNSFSGKGDIVQIAQCGVSVEALNPEAIAKGIEQLYNLEEETRKSMGKRGKEYVLEHFTYEKLAAKYHQLIEN